MCRRICSVRLVSFVNDVNRTNIFLEKNKDHAVSGNCLLS